jgi:hypothetical protein
MGEAGLMTHPGLAAVLTTPGRLRAVVEGLAYTAHRYPQAGADGDLPWGNALTFLEGPDYLQDAGVASAFLDYVDQRAGLLVGQGGELGKHTTYRFPHRTFQEYLAGCYLVGQRNKGRVFFQHASEGDVWGLATQLGAEELLSNRRMTHDLCDLAYDLCPADEPTSTQARRAVLAGQEAIIRDTGRPGGGAAYLQRLRPPCCCCYVATCQLLSVLTPEWPWRTWTIHASAPMPGIYQTSRCWALWRFQPGRF